MDMFNKIYSQVSSSVSSKVSQLSGVLPGNPVTREFDATTHIASAGPCLLWKIYKGTKYSTKQEASIFVFEKRQLERWNKADRDIILETLKRGVAQLTKIRHPRVLTVQHPLEESRESLAFATEPVFASLANILGQTTNMPQPANMSDYKLFDIEIKYGLLQIAEGLAFLHSDVKLLHKNIAPENIIINSQGAWKIFGLDFCVHNSNPPNATPLYPYEDISHLPTVARPNLDYLAPECVLNQTHSPASDMFSLGMVSYSVTSPTKHALMPINDLHDFRNRVQQLKSLNSSKLASVPEELRANVRLLINVEPKNRPDAHQFLKISYFEDVGIKTLTYLDSLLQWDNLQKSQFYKGLPEALTKLPHRVKVNRVLSCLTRDLAQPTMVPFILPSILDIAQNCTQDEYSTHILPHLKPVMKLMEPIQILLIFLQKMELLLKLTPAEDVQQHVLPMLYRGLDCETPQIHELCLSVLPTFANLLEHGSVKNSLLPRIKKLCLSTSTLSVRVNCLLCIGRLLDSLDKWLVLDEILPFLPQIPSREPAVLMGILGIYKLAMNHKKLGITKEIMATRILPFLIPLCIENGLSIAQFNALVALVKSMFQQVETEHRTKLEQLNTIKNEQKVLESQMPDLKTNSVQTGENLEQMFDSFGLEQTPAPIKPPPQPQNKLQELEPVKNSKPEVKSSTPKDLTASLMDEWTKITPPKPAPASNLNYPPPNINQMPFSSMSFNQFQNTSQTNTNPWSSNTNFTLNNRSNNNTAQNWSALDNLMPLNSSNKLPMNQMKPNQPLIPTPNSTNNNNQRSTLSNDDIMDLLS